MSTCDEIRNQGTCFYRGLSGKDVPGRERRTEDAAAQANRCRTGGQFSQSSPVDRHAWKIGKPT